MTPDQERELLGRLRFIAAATKSFDAYPTWRETTKRSRRHLDLAVGVRVDGTLAGTSVRLITPGYVWERDLYGHIEVYDPVIGRTLRLLPAEWRPNHPHDNPGCAPGRLRFLTLYSRYHPFEENAILGVGTFLQTVRGIAAPMPEFETFVDCRGFCGTLWNCPEMTNVDPPPWREDLL